jgi:hypothetical protein
MPLLRATATEYNSREYLTVVWKLVRDTLSPVDEETVFLLLLDE